MGERASSPVPRRLREARDHLGISQRELGVRAGLDPASASTRINQYERGRHAPDYGTLAALARILGRPVAFFYAEDDGLAAWICRYEAGAS